LRGKGRNKSFQTLPHILNVELLNKLPKDSVVDLENLAKHKLVLLEDVKKTGVKILGNGSLNVSLTVKLPVSRGALEKIKKAGGTVE
jgi:ribosomal protein L15